MLPVGFEPTILAGERPQTYALDPAATGTDEVSRLPVKILQFQNISKHTSHYTLQQVKDIF